MDIYTFYHLGEGMINGIKKKIIDKFFKRKIRIFNTETILGDENLETFYLKNHSVALHFNAPVSSIYQVEQWIPILNELNKVLKIAIITRRKSSFQWLCKNSNFSIIFTHTQYDFMQSLEENNFKCILYVNHGVQNFQSLSYRNALHIHINHGESEKISTISNQVNAYNYVFIVAKAAYDKYNLNLLQKNSKSFIKVGRPQLEHIVKIPSFETEKKVILYAPTWEGTHASMNYSSLGTFGYDMVHNILNDGRYYLVYKPHPNTGFNDMHVKKINQKILKSLENNINAKVIRNGDINSIYSHIDIAIFDNSAVAIDYLAVNKPMIMTDMFNKVKDRQSRLTIIKAALMISDENYIDILNIIDLELKKDSLKHQRVDIKSYFLGEYNYENQESTQKFIETLLSIVDERDKSIQQLSDLNKKQEGLVDESI